MLEISSSWAPSLSCAWNGGSMGLEVTLPFLNSNYIYIYISVALELMCHVFIVDHINRYLNSFKFELLINYKILKSPIIVKIGCCVIIILTNINLCLWYVMGPVVIDIRQKCAPRKLIWPMIIGLTFNFVGQWWIKWPTHNLDNNLNSCSVKVIMATFSPKCSSIHILL